MSFYGSAFFQLLYHCREPTTQLILERDQESKNASFFPPPHPSFSEWILCIILFFLTFLSLEFFLFMGITIYSFSSFI